MANRDNESFNIYTPGSAAYQSYYTDGMGGYSNFSAAQNPETSPELLALITMVQETVSEIRISQKEQIQEAFSEIRISQKEQAKELAVLGKDIAQIKQERAKQKEELAQIKQEGAKQKEELAQIVQERAKQKEELAQIEQEIAKVDEKMAKRKEESNEARDARINREIDQKLKEMLEESSQANGSHGVHLQGIEKTNKQPEVLQTNHINGKQRDSSRSNTLREKVTVGKDQKQIINEHRIRFRLEIDSLTARIKKLEERRNSKNKVHPPAASDQFLAILKAIGNVALRGFVHSAKIFNMFIPLPPEKKVVVVKAPKASF